MKPIYFFFRSGVAACALLVAPLLCQCNDPVSKGDAEDTVLKALRSDDIEAARRQIAEDTKPLPEFPTPEQKTLRIKVQDAGIKIADGVQNIAGGAKKRLDAWRSGATQPDVAEAEETQDAPSESARQWTQADFIQAAKCADVDTLEMIFKQESADMSVNSVAEGLTPLMWAARQGQSKSVERLLKKKADAAMVSDTGYTALMYAACNGDTACVEALADKEMIDKRNPKSGLSALMYVCLMAPEHHADVIKHLKRQEQKKGGIFNEYYPWFLKEKVESCRSLYDGITPLMLAARRGDLAMVELLAPDAEDIRQEDVHGNTCIDYAERSDNPAVTNYLRDKQGMPQWLQYTLGGAVLILALFVILIFLRYFFRFIWAFSLFD